MFFKEFKDTSKNTIAETAALLNRKPKRQGSNQNLFESVETYYFRNKKTGNFVGKENHKKLNPGLGGEAHMVTTATEDDANQYIEQLNKRAKESGLDHEYEKVPHSQLPKPPKGASWSHWRDNPNQKHKTEDQPPQLKRGESKPSTRKEPYNPHKAAAETSFSGPGSNGKSKHSILYPED